MIRLTLALCLALAACGGATEEEPKEPETRDTPFDPLTDQLERARDVEDTVEQHKRDLDAALEDADERDEGR